MLLDASGCNIWRTLSLATQTFGFKQVVDEARSKYHLFMYQEEEEKKYPHNFVFRINNSSGKEQSPGYTITEVLESQTFVTVFF